MSKHIIDALQRESHSFKTFENIDLFRPKMYFKKMAKQMIYIYVIYQF